MNIWHDWPGHKCRHEWKSATHSHTLGLSSGVKVTEATCQFRIEGICAGNQRTTYIRGDEEKGDISRSDIEVFYLGPTRLKQECPLRNSLSSISRAMHTGKHNSYLIVK
jgi:hypothetical protein